MSAIKKSSKTKCQEDLGWHLIDARDEPPEPGSEGYSSVLAAITKYYRLADL